VGKQSGGRAEPVILGGQSAYSEFRMTALLERVQKVAPGSGVTGVTARFVFFLEPTRAIPDETMRHALALLGAEGPFKPGDGFFVTPRKGTISPWSSKATDIFRNCGLDAIRRVERGIHFTIKAGSRVLGAAAVQPALTILHDRMTEGVYEDVSDLFAHMRPAALVEVDVTGKGRDALVRANKGMGLALNDEEIEYLFKSYSAIRRNPTDVELVMFGQVNSEHCRHKIFNAEWIVDGEKKDASLFGMIKQTHARHPSGTLVAYKDNAGILEGFDDGWFEVDRSGRTIYRFMPGKIDLVMKVETHNHPTAISPYPGAATGVGGEIRDECATGIGGKSRAGLSAFMVSNLRVPGFIMPWEKDFAEFPSRLATPLAIMIEGPIGGAGFGNEFGRPQLLGFFKTYEDMCAGRYRGYHKPIMVAGGAGVIKREHVHKKDLPAGALVIQLGGPAMKIGLGGGAASSMATGSNAAELDFDSVQRGNAEMERRCQEVIDACIAMGPENPILSIHDIGAGGLSNGCPELVSETGGGFHLRKVPSEDTSMSPMEIWCCEAQERYVLAIPGAARDRFKALCERERCPFSVIGEVTGDGHLSLDDDHFKNKPIDIDIGVILGRPPRMLRDVKRLAERHPPLNLAGVTVREAADRVLRLPAVANKTFLITITDRSVTGLVHRDQMVGPYQVPVADVAVIATSYRSTTGQAMAMGERSNVALISAPASGRLAVVEALMNIAASDIGDLGLVKLSANWMCACGEEGEDANLFDTVRAVAIDLCPALGISIPVGKDSLSMRTMWKDSGGKSRRQVAPLSLVVSAFAPVRDVRKTVTPDLKPGPSSVLLLDAGRGKNRLGGSALAQVFNQVGDTCPDIDEPADVVKVFNAVQALVDKGLLLAYHDRSDGGLFVTLAEMMFGGRVGLDVDLGSSRDVLAALFSEETGAVLQVADDKLGAAGDVINAVGAGDMCSVLGHSRPDHDFRVQAGGRDVFRSDLLDLQRTWSELTYRMQALRDNPECAREEYDNLLDKDDPGLRFHVTYDPGEMPGCSSIAAKRRPPMAILREQGVNGQVEMAAAFDRAGFECVDVHMTDLLSGRVDINDYAGFVACGGFSYGDVLGAGSGWAKSILFNEKLKDRFARFFARPETFALGVCNGCQMVSQLKGIIPGADQWPEFTRNRSEQFEARYVTLQIGKSPSIFFRGMEGSQIGIAVAHGEGFADFRHTGSLDAAKAAGLVAARYVDNRGLPTERYPYNPNGSPGGVTGFTTSDGRVTIMMPHPERGFRSLQMSYRPAGLFTGEDGPWMRMFRNARAFAG